MTDKELFIPMSPDAKPLEVGFVVLSPMERLQVAYIKSWHEKMMADSRTDGGLVDFHLREKQAHVFLGHVLKMLDV